MCCPKKGNIFFSVYLTFIYIGDPIETQRDLSQTNDKNYNNKI